MIMAKSFVISDSAYNKVNHLFKINDLNLTEHDLTPLSSLGILSCRLSHSTILRLHIRTSDSSLFMVLELFGRFGILQREVFANKCFDDELTLEHSGYTYDVRFQRETSQKRTG